MGDQCSGVACWPDPDYALSAIQSGLVSPGNRFIAGTAYERSTLASVMRCVFCERFSLPAPLGPT